MTIFETILFANVLRFVVIVLGGIGATYGGFAIYYFLQRFATAHRINGESKRHLSDILFHVVMVCIPTCGALLYTMFESLTRVNQPITWRAPYFLLMNALFVASLRAMSQLQSRKTREMKRI